MKKTVEVVIKYVEVFRCRFFTAFNLDDSPAFGFHACESDGRFVLQKKKKQLLDM